MQTAFDLSLHNSVARGVWQMKRHRSRGHVLLGAEHRFAEDHFEPTSLFSAYACALGFESRRLSGHHQRVELPRTWKSSGNAWNFCFIMAMCLWSLKPMNKRIGSFFLTAHLNIAHPGVPAFFQKHYAFEKQAYSRHGAHDLIVDCHQLLFNFNSLFISIFLHWSVDPPSLTSLLRRQVSWS